MVDGDDGVVVVGRPILALLTPKIVRSGLVQRYPSVQHYRMDHVGKCFDMLVGTSHNFDHQVLPLLCISEVTFRPSPLLPPELL
jgi:hypothetical protein